jgi:hypothetical protein
VSGPATLSGNILTITGQGQVTVSAVQAGNAEYQAANVTQTFVVYGEDQKKDAVKITVSVYPNPTQGLITVKLKDKEDRDYYFKVYDKNGNPLQSLILWKNNNKAEIETDLSFYPPGQYFIEVTNSSGLRIVRQIFKN